MKALIKSLDEVLLEKAGKKLPPKKSGYVELDSKAEGFVCKTCVKYDSKRSWCKGWDSPVSGSNGCCNSWSNSKLERVRV